MKRICAALFLFAFALPAIAQVSYSSITGTVTDASSNPLAYATIIATLVNAQGFPVSSASTPNGQLYNAKPVIATLDQNGSFAIGLVPNGILSKPSGTQWKIAISAPQDSAIITFAPAWTVNYQFTVTGNADISAQLTSQVTSPISFFNAKTGQSTIVGQNGCPLVGCTFTGTVVAPNISASINQIINVTAAPYNVICDGSSTHHATNQTGFNLAMSTAMTNGWTIQVPAGKCYTDTITYNGQSIFGAGKNQTYIQGMPGEDVFAGPDVSSPTYLLNASIHDFTIIVDDSVNVASTVVGGNGNFPNRISGTSGGGGTVGPIVALTNPPAMGPVVFGSTSSGVVSGGCTGASITASSTTLTCTAGDAEWASLGLTNPQIIGAPITVFGAGPSGGNLTTTIAAVLSNSSFQLAAAASTTVSGGSGNFGGTNFQAPWYFGNCGMAFPGTSNAGVGPNNWKFSNINFARSGSTNARSNHACAIFMQADAYAMRFDHMQITGFYGGIIEALPNSYTGLFLWSPDTSSYTDVDFSFNSLPLVMYNGGGRVMSNVNFYAGEQIFAYGPFEFHPNSGGQNATTQVHGLFYECFAPNSGENARWSGQVTIDGGNGLDEGVSKGGQSYTAWYGNQGTTDIPVGALNIYGNANMFKHVGSGIVVNDFGMDNTVDQTTVPITGGRRYYSNRPREPLNKLDGGFLLTGNSAAPYTSGADLLITCTEFNFAFNTGSGGGTAPGCTNDPTGTEITQSYVAMTSSTHPSGWQMVGTGTSQGQGPLGKFLVVGDRLPKVKTTFVSVARCNASCTHNIQISNDTQHVFIANVGVTYGTTWTVQTFTVDLSTANVGDLIGVQVPSSGLWSGYTEEDLALYAFEPVNSDALAGVTSAINTALASPPAIGSTTPAVGTFTSLTATANFTAANVLATSTAASVTMNCITTFASGSCLRTIEAPSGEFAADQWQYGSTRYWLSGLLIGTGNDFVFQSSQHSNHNVLRLNAATDAVTTVNNTLDDGSGNANFLGGVVVQSIATSPSPNPICPNGTGGKLTTSGCTSASGTVNSGANYKIGAYSLGAGTTIGPAAGLATDSTGNDLFIPGYIGVGASVPAACGTATSCDAYFEVSTAGTPTAGQDYIRADSASHSFKMSLNGGAETSIGATSLPSATDTKDKVAVNPSGVGSIISPTIDVYNVVLNGGFDNTGTTDESSALATLLTSGITEPIYFPPGTYNFNAGAHAVFTSSTGSGLNIIGAGRGQTVFQSTCSSGLPLLWFDYGTNNVTSGSYYNGPKITGISLSDTSGTGACNSGIRITQVANFHLYDIEPDNFKGKVYSTGTVTVTNGSTSVTSSGATFTAAMVAGQAQLQVAGRKQFVCSQTSTTLTLCVPWQQATASATAYALDYGGTGLLFDGGSNYVQYGMVDGFWSQGDMVAIGDVPYASSASGVGTSRIWIRGGFIDGGVPGSRLTDSTGGAFGGFTDTITWDIAVNNVAWGTFWENSHDNKIMGFVEDNSTVTPVTTCNGGVGSQSCIVGHEFTADTSGHSFGNSIETDEVYLTGNAVYIGSTAASFISIMAPKWMNSGGASGNTNDFNFMGTTGCPANASGNHATIVAWNCVHFTSAVGVN